ncbi:heterokaryon incompatibility protein-domain-containing protein [Halenospora varia]|nr:heterokaryon incompatibility protein-domain-containing protein [Halenospora varia]
MCWKQQRPKIRLSCSQLVDRNSSIARLVRFKHRRRSEACKDGIIHANPVDGTCEPKLVEPRAFQPRSHIEWVTLSHCWGGISPLTTTLAVLYNRWSSIPLLDMPQTFCDAVLITRKMGIRYLWIDSLCIIQDSEEDWTKEAALMGDVYRYGILNIAVNTGGGYYAGIFTSRSTNEEHLSNTIRLPLSSKSREISAHIYARYGRWDDYRLRWVLQESVLSPRTIHYSKNVGILHSQKDLNLSRRPLVQTWVSNKMVIPQGMIRSYLEPSESVLSISKPRDIYLCWMMLVKGYTVRKLAFPLDIFAVLGRVASISRKTLNERYLAGLFEGDLLVNLPWFRVDYHSAQKMLPSIGPSWSWESTIGPIIPEIPS